MEGRVRTTILVLFLITINANGDSARTKRRLLDFRKMMKVFVRYNVKVNVVPYTSIFAFAMGFRANWDIKPDRIHIKKKIYDQQYQNSQYQIQRYYESPYQYQRAIHSAVQGAFDWHGFNGTACLQRTLCEVSLIHHEDVISQIFKTIFNGTEEMSCPEEIPCPVSLLELVDHVLSGSTTK